MKLIGLDYILWNLFTSSGVFDIWDIRNLGLWGGFGLGVYVVLIISFSLIYYKKRKLYSQLCILFVLIYSILSGQRQTIFFIVIFFLVYIVIIIIKQKISNTSLNIVIGTIFLLIVFWQPIISKTIVFKRFQSAFELLEQGLYLEASGRQVQDLPIVISDLRTYPLTGRGSLNLGYTNGSTRNLANHVVWFNIYQKFGVAGVLFLLIILIYPITKLLIISKKTTNNSVLRESTILFSLMIVVFAQQFWDNFFSYSNTMLLYAFVYFWILSFINRVKLLQGSLLIYNKL